MRFVTEQELKNHNNKPYGLRRLTSVKWEAFREYERLDTLPLGGQYFQFDDSVIPQIFPEIDISRDQQGKACKVWLYNSDTDPRYSGKWDDYWIKIGRLYDAQKQ